MEGSTGSGKKMVVRTVVFAALAAAVLLGLATGLSVQRPPAQARQKGELYRREGNAFFRMYFAASGASSERIALRFLEHSKYYYQLSAQADPSDVRSLVSLALVLDELGERETALRILSAAANQEGPVQQQSAVSATLVLVLSRQPRPEYLEAAGDFLRGLPPGRMALAEGYERMGQVELAEREWRAAEAENTTFLRRMLAMLVVCGLIVTAGIVGLFFAVGRAIARRLSERAEAPPTPPIEAKWGVREAVEGFILWLFAATALRAALPPGWPHEAVYPLLPGLAAGAVGIAWVWAVSPSGARLGWRLTRWWRQAAVGLAAAGLSAIPVLSLYQLLQYMQARHMYLSPRGLPGPDLPEEHPLVPLFLSQGKWQWQVILIAAACVVVPVLEETLFRGILFGVLRRHSSFAPAAVGSAAVFAVVHLSWVGLVPYMLLGLLFAFLYERTGSLVAPWAAHGVFNGFNLAILLALFG